MGLDIVVCGSVVPEPLQVLDVAEPIGIKNQMMLPHILDPWAAHALFEAANLAKNKPSTEVWLFSMGPKAKIQQVMMTIAQKARFNLVVIDSKDTGFSDSASNAKIISEYIRDNSKIDKSNLLIFGGWESASRSSGTTLQIIGERLNITNQFYGVDLIKFIDDRSFEVHERVEGGKHLVSLCSGPRAVLGWATGNLPEPPNNPQIGMANMKSIMSAIQSSKLVEITEKTKFIKAEKLTQSRNTKVVKNMSIDEIASEIVDWIRK